MDRNTIIQRSKMLDEEKVAVSLRLPITLKKKLQQKVDSENISMNTLIVETLYSLLNDDCGKEIKYLSEKLKQALEIITYFKDEIILTDDEIKEWSQSSGLTKTLIDERNRFLIERLKMNDVIENLLEGNKNESTD